MGSGPLSGNSYAINLQASADPANGNTHIGTDDLIKGLLYVENRVKPCFTRGTHILTSSGEIMVENLKVGDEVLTHGHRNQPIRWIGRTTLSESDLKKIHNLRP